MSVRELVHHAGVTGADPGFFLGRGAPLRNGVSDVFFSFFGEYQLY